MIEVKNLTKIYKSKNKVECVALDNVSFTLEDKGLVFIVGKSGSGKSTLLYMIGGLDSITSGTIDVFGNELSNLNENKLNAYRSSLIGFIFHDFHLLDDLTIQENISISLKLQGNNDLTLIDEALEKVALKGYNHRYPKELSGGQKQRVAIARALIKNPDIILADEPTGNLDSNTTKQIIELIKEISKEKLVIVVSHNLYDAYDYADRIIELSSGKVINDLVVNKDYSNSIKIEENKIILPLLRRFSDEELDFILTSCKDENIKKIKQDNTKFIKYKENIKSGRKSTIKKSTLSAKETFKFSYLFGKNRGLGFVLSSFMAAVIIVVLALAQSIAYFEPSRLINERVVNQDSVYCVRKELSTEIGETNVKIINDEEFEYFENLDGNVKAYPLYSLSLRVNEGSMIDTLTLPNEVGKKLYVGQSCGTLVTTEEYAKRLLEVDELEIYKGEIPQIPSGVYITDYLADSFLLYTEALTYDDVLGDVYEGESFLWGYVNGIIKTGYKDRYADIIEEMKNNPEEDYLTEEYVGFFDYVMHSLAIGYSFDENYIENYLNDPIRKSYQWLYKSKINGIDTSDMIRNITTADFTQRDLKDNEVFMNVELYNSIFNTNYTSSTAKNFIPHEAYLEASDEYEDISFSKMVKIVGLGYTKASRLEVSSEMFKEIKETMIARYGIYFDGDDLSTIVDYCMNNEYAAISIEMSAIQTMIKAVSIFENFFTLIVVILLVGCAFIVIGFGIKNIKSRMYEIGVLKALGCNYINFVVMFSLHTFVIALFTIFFSTIGFAVFSDLANNILVESLKMLATKSIMINLEFIYFNVNLISFDSILVLLISLLSTIVPTILIKQIKPITIIKAKE